MPNVSQSKKYNTHFLICKNLESFIVIKINVILYKLAKYMNFSPGNKLVFIDSFQFLSSSLDNLFKSNFEHLSLEFGNGVFNLAKRRFISYEYILVLKHLTKNYLAKTSFMAY